MVSEGGFGLRSFAPSSSRGLAIPHFEGFGSTLTLLNDEVTRVITCFARVVTNFAGFPKHVPTRASIWCIFTVKIRGNQRRRDDPYRAV